MANFKQSTISARAGIETETQHGDVTPALHLSSNFTFSGFGQPRQYDYSRSGNPTRALLAKTLAELENGADAVITSSGMSAITLALQLLKPADLLIAPHDCYGGTFRLFTSLAEKGAFRLKFVDQTDSTALDAAMAEKPALLWVESPSNPLLRVVCIKTLVEKAKSVDALVLVDNTFLSPALQQPLNLGADLVLHSTTKYINGHSDVVGGAIIAKDPQIAEELAFWGNCLGLTGSPFDSFLTLRGLRTLKPRLRQHQENTAALVELLVEHPAVTRVYYPGLKSDPGHEIASKQQSGFGAMISFELAGDTANVEQLVHSLELFSLAESLGGVESLIAHPATMTHASMTAEARKTAGISEQLLRLSVGIEDAEDLLIDFKRALDSCLLADKSLNEVLAA
ncbi:MAG: O-succinylhomoserine (thiol)-lyase [Gammaproteobacteria bacterium]|nr:MAG: O-succinylhomoserine (thiol)-lyase [Gammaproteobacteria bacterium]